MPSYKQGLREGRLVAFVVAAPAVAVHVDHDVALKVVPKVHGQANHLRDRFGIFAVHVEDRDLQHLGDVGGVRARARLVRAAW